MDGTLKTISVAAFLVCACLICVLIVLPQDFFQPKKQEWRQSTVIEPDFSGAAADERDDDVRRMPYESGLRTTLELESGEVQTAAISEDFDGDGADEQIIAYRNLTEKDNPIYVTFVDYDESGKTYKRLWSAPTGATKPGTLSLFSIDLTGDHINEVVVTGMNQNDEQILKAFKINRTTEEGAPAYKRIADLKIDGTISVLETERSQAYQLGFAGGVSFNISDRGRDAYSGNELDQIENIYAYNPIDGAYERIRTTKIPGAQIEERRLKELLSGNKTEFEQFIDGLWYQVSGDGTVDNEQYIYFDTSSGEVIFYSGDTQQVYAWQNSYPTRYGMYISSQNISVPTLNRKINLELESLDSVRVKISEDVRMRIFMNAPWDGSYRKVKVAHNVEKKDAAAAPYIDAEYNSPIGRIAFLPDGAYNIELNGHYRNGRYSFFSLENNELLEFVPDGNPGVQGAPAGPRDARQTYKVVRGGQDADGISLTRVRLSTNGISEFNETAVQLSPIARSTDG
ncbi:MAG: pallilysin-related adhesin [Spirochaetaceae bacterium]|jgi:hypothetical protein|nr:pallilysin-related adhesin [Spirochaetaceae bacterium]